MKTIEEFYNEAMADKELAEAAFNALTENRLTEFLTEHGVDGTEQQFLQLLNEKADTDRILTDEALNQVSGGYINPKQEAIMDEIRKFVVAGKKIRDQETLIVYKVVGMIVERRAIVYLIPYVDDVQQNVIWVDGETFLNDLKSGKYGEFRAMYR